MTTDEFLNLKTASEMWRAFLAHPELRIKKCETAFQKLREQEFEERIIKREGSYNPDMHYDLNKQK